MEKSFIASEHESQIYNKWKEKKNGKKTSYTIFCWDREYEVN